MIPVTNLNECEAVDQFLDHPDDNSFTSVFRVFTPQLVAFFRRRGHDVVVAEDLAQEVMLSVHRNARQIRDRTLFRAWLFRIARNTICHHFAKRTREVPTVDLAEVGDRIAAAAHKPESGPGFEFVAWMAFLEPRERDVMRLRFVEEWEYHEIAAAQSIPIGTVQWRVFNSKKKLAAHLSRRQEPARQAA
jgi:RNA polymerase sigma-70 factor (ECF subfamily)